MSDRQSQAVWVRGAVWGGAWRKGAWRESQIRCLKAGQSQGAEASQALQETGHLCASSQAGAVGGPCSVIQALDPWGPGTLGI